MENEKKVTELNEEELNDVAGGYARSPYGAATPVRSFVILECPACGHSFRVKGSESYNATCPKCGSKVK